MDLIAVVIAGLAGWRIANLFLYEDGPWEIFAKFRKLVGIKPGRVEGFFPTLFSCIYCLGFWTALGAFLLFRIFPDAAIVIAAAAVVILVDKAASRE